MMQAISTLSAPLGTSVGVGVGAVVRNESGHVLFLKRGVAARNDRDAGPAQEARCCLVSGLNRPLSVKCGKSAV